MSKGQQLLGDHDFLKLWSGQTVSLLGTQITLLALPLVAILTLDASAFEVALLNAVDFLPFVLFGLPAGVWVDRLRRKPLLIASDLGRALVLLSVPVAYWLDALAMPQLYVVGFAAGSLAAAFDLAYLSYVPTLVGRERIVEANAKLEGSRSATHIVGPTVAGGLVAALTAPVAVLVDALTYLVSAFSVALIRRPEPPPPPVAERQPMRRELGEGLRYVFGHRLLRVLIACTGAWTFFSALGSAILLVYLVRDLGYSPGALGVLITLGGVGALLGALAVRPLGTAVGIGPAMVFCALLSGPAIALIPLAPQDRATPFVAASFLVGAFGLTVFTITQLSLRQAITPERLHGRMNAVVRGMYWLGYPTGSVLGGAVATLIGVRETLALSAVGTSLAFVPLLFSAVLRLRTIPEVDDGEIEPAHA